MIALPVVAVLLACSHTLLALNQLWLDSARTTYTHGHLVALVSLWLLWQQRRERAALPFAPSKATLLPLFVAGAAWVFAVQSGIQAAELVLLPVLLGLAVWAAQGAARARHAAFAFGYLYFAMPVWDFGGDLLQWGTIYANRAMLTLVGIPTFFEGNAVQIPDGVFHIEGGCSGLHFFLVGLAIAALLGELRRDGFAGRVKLLVLAGVLAVLTNWVRVFTIILAGHFTHMQHYLVRVSHYGYGWVLFAVAMVVFFWLERRIAVTAQAQAPGAQAATPAGAWRAQGATVAVLALIALWHTLAARPSAVDATLPAAAEGWQREPATWQPKVTGSDAAMAARYVHGEEAVDLYHAAYGHQEQDKEFTGFNNDLLGGLKPADLPPLGSTAPALQLLAGRDATGSLWLIGADYSVDSHHGTRALRAQLRYAQASMTALRSPPSRLRVLRAACHPGCNAAATLLQQFLATASLPGREP